MSGSKMKATNEQIIEAYNRRGNIWRVGEELGMCGQSVQERLIRLGIKRNNPPFTEGDMTFLKEYYQEYAGAGKLQELADIMERTKPFISRQARKSGLTSYKRDHKMYSNYEQIKLNCQGMWDRRPHPKGMLGKKHAPDFGERMSPINKAAQARINADPERRAAITRKMMATKYQRGNAVRQRPETSWKAGWREIGGKRKYFRSRWEANYARYLEFLKTHGEIKEWEHECEVFWFEGIKRGCMSYLPDFKITNNNESNEFHEVKGWMDERSKTKINRMRIYHPNVKLLLIKEKWFKDNGRKLKGLIPEWE